MATVSWNLEAFSWFGTSDQHYFLSLCSKAACNVTVILFYVAKSFVCLIFVFDLNHENILTTNNSQITVCHVLCFTLF